MDSSPPPNSPGSSVPDRNAPQLPSRLRPSGSARASNAIAQVDALRHALSAGNISTDSILRAATDVARVLTRAHGTALALRTNGVIVCRARSGDIAPELGVPLNLDSGISAGCLRTATILICNDAATDTRVDLEACLTLGVRSIVAVPIRGAMGVAGILEAFSTRPNAFGAEQMESLKALAEIAETAYDREGLSQSPTASSVIAAANRSSRFASRGEQTHAGKFSDQTSPRRRYWIPAVVAIALLLVSMVVWLSWREPAEIAAAEAAPTALRRPEKPSGHPAPHVLPLSPEPGVGGRESDRLRTKNVLQNAAEIGPATGGPRPSSSATDLSEPNAVENSALRSAPPGSASEPPPTVEVTASTIPDELAGLSSAPAALPAFGASVSTGVIEGNLIHRVEPTYPQQARIQKLVGAVVLDATVAEDGSVREVKVVNGSPLLAAAATAAVQQWRYRPSQLNGKPIAVEKQITIVFKLP